MKYLGWKITGYSKYFKERLMRTWLAYDHKYNIFFLFTKGRKNKVFWVFCERKKHDDFVCEIQHDSYELTLKQLHEKYHCPKEIKNETRIIKTLFDTNM